MKKVIVAIVVVLTVGFRVTSCKSEQKDAKEVEKEVVEEVKEVEVKEVKEVKAEIMALAVYQCPMDCEEGKTYTKPGQCPVCKMDLKMKKTEGNKDSHDHESGEGHEQKGETEEQEG